MEERQQVEQPEGSASDSESTSEDSSNDEQENEPDKMSTALRGRIAGTSITKNPLEHQTARQEQLVSHLGNVPELNQMIEDECLNDLAMEAIREVSPGGPLNAEMLTVFLNRALYNVHRPMLRIVPEEARENVEELTNYLRAVVAYMKKDPGYSSTRNTIRRIKMLVRRLKLESG